jgi:hypothetical protein
MGRRGTIMSQRKPQDSKSTAQHWNFSFLSVVSGGDQRRDLAKGRPLPAHGDRWGVWFYDARGGLLIRKDEHGPEYAVSLLKLDANNLADGLAKLSGSWLSDSDIGSFVRAVGDLVGLQGLAQRA